MLRLLAPFVVFGIVVFVHELGHFLAAKLVGVYAPVFSLGWGRRWFGRRIGETDYRMSIFPIGGYVRMASRDDESMAGIEGGSDRGAFDATGAAERIAANREAAGKLWDEQALAPFGPKVVPSSRWFEAKPLWARLLVLSAGVLMNIALTMTVLTGLNLSRGRVYVPAVVDSVLAGQPAAIAGLQAGDSIVAVGGTPVTEWSQVVERISAVTTGSIALEIMRGGARSTRDISPVARDVTDPETGRTSRVGRIGVAVRDGRARVPLSFGEAVASGASETWMMATRISDVLGGLFSGRVAVTNLGGPITIARSSVEAAKGGMENLWLLIAFLSINIAIFNLLPVPLLDGGQIVLALIEGVKGSAVSMRTREWLARAGVAAVLTLFVLVTFNDVRALFTP
jgi:regulator of sigma E protease